MKKIFAIAWKDTLLRFTGWSEWLFFLILPIVFTLILAGGTGGSSDNRVRLVVVDQANSPLSADLVSCAGKFPGCPPRIMTLAQAETQFSQRSASAVLIIPAEFDLAHLEQGSIQLELRQQPNNMNAMVAQRAVMSVISRVSSAVDIANQSVAKAEQIQPFASTADRQAYFNAALKQAQSLLSAAPSRITESKGNTKDPINYNPRANSSAGQLITWVFIPLIGISAMFAYERQKGTLRRLLTTPTRKSTYLLGTIFGQVVTALVQMLLLVAFGIFVMKLNWGSQPLALAVMMVSVGAGCGGPGHHVGHLCQDGRPGHRLEHHDRHGHGPAGRLLVSARNVPPDRAEYRQDFADHLGHAGLAGYRPARPGLAAVLPDAAILLGFAVAFLGIGIWRFKYE